ESSLASDDVLAHYFNDFLSLPCFMEALLYNQGTGLFEVINGEANSVTRRIRTELNCRKSQLLSGDPAEMTRTSPVENHYTVCCLDKEQGIQWIIRERLPFFLQSDCYYEYRLAKLLLQWDPKNSGPLTFSAPQLHCHSQFRQFKSDTLKASHSPENISENSGFSSPLKKCNWTQEWHSSQTKLNLGFRGLSAGIREEKLRESNCQIFASPEQHLEHLLDGKSLTNTSESASKSGHQSSCAPTGKNLSEGKERERLDNKKVQDGSMETQTQGNETNRMVGSSVTKQEDFLEMCWHDTCCHSERPDLHEFKDFLQGTPGQKLFDLWLDIERLKTIQPMERKDRHLFLMRSWYLLSSSQRSLNVELLSSLGLTTSPCWTGEKLRSVQPSLTESLLCYWFDSQAPRFWMFWCFEKCPLSAQICHGSNILPCLQLNTCLTLCPYSANSQLSSTRSRLLCSRRLKQMLQALFAESRSGLYFTHFCEQSGNQLWVNAVYFWTDLQHYHELFYQDGLDPYIVQREAQFLYSNYIFNVARRSIDVDEEISREVYNRLWPAFEELFDEAEEHALTILLEPWTLLANRDKDSLQKEYRELQVLYEVSEQQLKQPKEPCRSMNFPPTKGSHARESWLSVPSSYQGYNLEWLLRQRHEIDHFIIHLMCWLDLEQYRRTHQRDTAVIQEMSSHIASKYLNREYFFGSDSPATAKQQNDILRLTGGLEHLKLECLTNPVITIIQDIVRNHIEEKWLPLFLSTAEFTQRQKHKPKLQAANNLSQHNVLRRKLRKEAWKAQGWWMYSSGEILLFRRILLNPSTCQQFQNFVSLKGDFLENDVRFWLEVQRYKDLCHSHSDEVTIQQKISTIISCFINSSMPPTVQIDIPPDQAQRILDRRHKLGPYIFREAQISVFSELLKFWPEFQEFSSSIQDEKLLRLLKNKRVKCKTRQWRQRRKEEEDEERSAQEEQERPKSCVSEEKDETEDEEKEQEGRSDSKQTQTHSSVLFTPTQPLLWSYSKYMAGLKKEELLLRKQSQMETSTVSDSSSEYRAKWGSSKRSFPKSSPRSDSKQCNSLKSHS
ncbi:unnamed protein product, partial [Menidia menidia]